MFRSASGLASGYTQNTIIYKYILISKFSSNKKKNGNRRKSSIKTMILSSYILF